MTTEERDALVMAPVGTPGLEALGLDDPEFSDLQNLGDGAKEKVRRLHAQYRAWRAVQAYRQLERELIGLPDDDRKALLEALRG
jgi:hypothetical protein